MDGFANTSELVMSVLTNDKKSRNSDNYLFYIVCKTLLSNKGINIDTIGFAKLFLSLKDYGLPQYETVGRIRRKIQHDFLELTGCDNVNKQRAWEEDSFHAWANEN